MVIPSQDRCRQNELPAEQLLVISMTSSPASLEYVDSNSK